MTKPAMPKFRCKDRGRKNGTKCGIREVEQWGRRVSEVVHRRSRGKYKSTVQESGVSQ